MLRLIEAACHVLIAAMALFLCVLTLVRADFNAFTLLWGILLLCGALANGGFAYESLKGKKQ